MNDLEWYSTRELIAELMRRTTFQGVVVQSEHEVRGPAWAEDRTFKVHWNGNLDTGEAGRLLDVVAAHLNRVAD